MLVVRMTPDHKPEKQYVLHVLLREMLGVEFRTEYRMELPGCEIVTPEGRALIMEDHFFDKRMQGRPYTAGELPQQVIAVSGEDGVSFITLYGNDKVEHSGNITLLGADLIASAFFMLTRWEESVVTARDAFGRFSGINALAHQMGFLERPVVEEWAAAIRSFLHLPAPKHAPSPVVLSCDVDHPQLWPSALSRGRTLAGALWRDAQSGRWSETRWWRQAAMGKAGDPFDTFEQLMSWGEQNNSAVQFNFLSKRPRSYDCWYDLNHPFVRRLLAVIHQRGHTTGFHPSREAAADPKRFEQELRDLRAVTRAEVHTGRNHYLMFNAPETWQMWENEGLKTDSTTGYHDLPGFRCGICRPFTVFNFRTRQMLKLQEQPLVAMEVTFAQYLRFDPEQTLNKLTALKAQCDAHGGEFTLLWHNSSFNTPFWAPYRPVFEQILC